MIIRFQIMDDSNDLSKYIREINVSDYVLIDL